MTFTQAFGFLCEMGQLLGFRPDFPEGMEEFLSKLLEPIEAEGDSNDRLRQAITDAFRSFDGRPRWLQDPQWPLSRGEPMIFIGQLDRRIDNLDVTFYVFKDRSVGITKVVTQVLGTIS